MLLACTALVAPGFALANAPALPQGGQFVAGQGNIGAASGNALTVTQTSARGIIDWRSFNIGHGASVTVQNGAGATLNRVTGGDLSQILGSLRATGSLYLVNPQGVVIGSSGFVVTGGRFVASSLDIANDAFMAGGTLVFRGSTENAEVRNLGSISSTGGDVILISRSVRNEGTITAPRGTAALAAGTEVLLREGPEGHRGLVRVSGASGDVTNAGRIEAAQAELRAAGGNIYALAGNTGGVIRATGTETRQGRVWLSAGAGTGSGNVVHEGRIEARNADGTGGKVAVRAGNAVLNTGTIAADGSSGGAVRVRAARVVQQGTISARGTSGAGGTVTQRVTASYTDTARAVTTADGATNGGAVRIEAEGSGVSVFASGRISATGESGTGGTVHLLSERIALMAAQVDASGATGGGVVRIGGGYRGGEDLPQARDVTVNPATTIRADATRNGQGGDAVIWSTERTRFYGTMTARGGAEGGDGGRLEISSIGGYVYAGQADAAAPNGRAGTLLLDPKNIIIDDGPATPFTSVGRELISPFTSVSGGSVTSVSDRFGRGIPFVLPNGNIVITDSGNDTLASNGGAVFLFNGVTGALISSLLGSNADDGVGGTLSSSVTVLTNGDFVVASPAWNGTRGAVTWGSGTTGVIGTVVSGHNSLVGSNVGDRVGGSSQTGWGGVTALPNGSYVVRSPDWGGRRGAATWSSGSASITGPVTDRNSLIGSTQAVDNVGGDRVGESLVVLTNGNYVISSPNWNSRRGAATWGSGTGGVFGVVSDRNSLIGSDAFDDVGHNVIALSNGHYLVRSPNWRSWRGAVTWGDGATGTIRGEVTRDNSLIGSRSEDYVGDLPGNTTGVVLLSDGNYVVRSPRWGNFRGAVTWGSATTGITGEISQNNSLVGSTERVNNVGGDWVGSAVTALSDGRYVAVSPEWNGARGAVTFRSAETGFTGVVSTSNSLVGGSANDRVGIEGVVVLTNGNYVVRSPRWGNFRGAVTWGSGTAGIIDVVSDRNSLVGSTQAVNNVGGDRVGGSSQQGVGGVTRLTNGHYVVLSPNWGGRRGAATWGDGTAGVTTGEVTDRNSLVGTTQAVNNVGGDQVGWAGAREVGSSNYVVNSLYWSGNSGASTWGSGQGGVTGEVSAANSLVGTPGASALVVTVLTNGNYVVGHINWNGSRGAVTWADGNARTFGQVSEERSLVGSQANDQVGLAVHALANGNYVVASQNWANGGALRAGALTWGNGTGGTRGRVSASNSLVGSQLNDRVGSTVQTLPTGDYIAQSSLWSNGNVPNAGAITWGNGTTGIAGTVSASNSVVSNQSVGLSFSGAFNAATGQLVMPSSGTNSILLIEPGNPFSNATAYSQLPGDTIRFSATRLASTLATGTAVTLQANNDITVAVPVTVTGTGGGAMTLQAGRSILLNASLATANGALTLIANDRLSSGVVDAHRDPGPASITMAAGTAIEAGSGHVTLRLLDGAGKTNREIGSVGLGTVRTTGTLAVDSQGAVTVGGAGVTAGRVNINAAAQLTLAAPVTASGTGDALVLSGREVRNTGGSLAAPNGRWLVFAADPSRVTAGGLLAARWYNQGFASFVPDTTRIGAGNRFVFSQAPVLTVEPAVRAIIIGRPVPQTFAITGMVNGDTDAEAWNGTPMIVASGLGPDGRTVTLTALRGTLTSDSNYGFAFQTATAQGTVEANDIIGTSNIPPPLAQLGAPEGGIRPVVSGPGAAVPLRAASNECGAGASVGIVRCASGFPALQN